MAFLCDNAGTLNCSKLRTFFLFLFPIHKIRVPVSEGN